MKLPRGDDAWIPEGKLAGYLLSEDHPTGGEKAGFFRHLGYTDKNAAALERQLLRLGTTEPLAREIRTAYGTKYVVEGYLSDTTGEPKRVRTVWIVDRGEAVPRFVTAYPV